MVTIVPADVLVPDSAVPSTGKGWWDDIDGLVQDCSISSALAMEILQSCTKPLMWDLITF